MSLPQKLLLRLLIYAALALYLSLDLLVFRGPVSRMLQEKGPSEEELAALAEADGIAASAYAQPVYREQVRQKMAELSWRRGSSARALTDQLKEDEALHLLLDQLLIKIQIKVSGLQDFPIEEEEIDEAASRFQARFPDTDSLNKTLQQQGWIGGTKEIRLRLAGRLQREDYLRHQLRPYQEAYYPVTPEDWYAQNRDSFPEPPPTYLEAKQSIQTALEALSRQKALSDFPKILRERAKGKIRLSPET